MLRDPGADALAVGLRPGHLANVLALVADSLSDLGVADFAVQPGESEDLAEIMVGDRGAHVCAFQHVWRQSGRCRSGFGHFTSPL